MSILLCGCEEKNIRVIDPDEFINSENAGIITEESSFPDSLSAQVMGEVRESSTGRFYYESLDSEDKILYVEIAGTLLKRLDDVRVSSSDIEKINDIFNLVMKDYPEIFYVNALSLKKYSQGGVQKCVSLSGTYTMSEEEISEAWPLIEDYLNGFNLYYESTYPNTLDDYHLIKAAYEFIINNTEYDRNSSNNQDITSVVKGRKSVCSGYAKMFQYILNQHGIECALVSGTVDDTQSHAWNLVKADGEYYYSDTTWGDSSYQISNQEKLKGKAFPSISYSYLLVTTDEISKTHKTDGKIKLPECNCLDDNYYVREGLYFSSVDKELLKEVFERAYSDNDETLTIKMSDDNTYKDMKQYLLKDQKIFDYYKSSGTVTYVEDPKHNCMIFWLLI